MTTLAPVFLLAVLVHFMYAKFVYITCDGFVYILICDEFVRMMSDEMEYRGQDVVMYQMCGEFVYH